MKETLRVAITAGEPAGIGPDIIIQLAQQDRQEEWIVLGNAELLSERAERLGLPLSIRAFDQTEPPRADKTSELCVKNIPLSSPCISGQLDTNNADHVITMLTDAAQGCLAGTYSAMITAPVHKGIINDAGIEFSGHTEFLAQQCGDIKPVMLLANEHMRVALATTHIPLHAVSKHITEASLSHVLTILRNDLIDKFNISSPVIFVTGLNPHAGEDGHLGSEEIDTITPTLEKLRKKGFNLIGPLPADTLFSPENLSSADAILAMYHDQGLPVLKYAGFGDSINITLGLPIIRTSVDHGTALTLAGTGKANANSLQTAINLATTLARKSI